MIQSSRLDYLLGYLLEEDKRYASIQIPQSYEQKKELFNWLMQARPVTSFSKEFRQVYTEFLQEEKERSNRVTIQDLTPIQPHFYLWQGSLKSLDADAFVSRESQSLENELLEGSASLEIQKLPQASRILYADLPQAEEQLSGRQYNELCQCYWKVLDEASQNKCRSIAIDTRPGKESGFPAEIMARAAVSTVSEYMRATRRCFEVIFNVAQEEDYRIYEQALNRR